MKSMDSYGLKLCAFQADIFEESLSATDCGSRIFVRRFMMSKLAKRMDGGGSLFEGIDVSAAINEISDQYGPSSFGKDRYGAQEIHWMGYIYRYWCYIFELSSKQVYRIIKPDELNKLYYPYHSLDPEVAIQRILESKRITPENDIIRGAQVMRRIRAKY